jgi:hypothetical protein
MITGRFHPGAIPPILLPQAARLDDHVAGPVAADPGRDEAATSPREA